MTTCELLGAVVGGTAGYFGGKAIGTKIKRNNKYIVRGLAILGGVIGSTLGEAWIVHVPYTASICSNTPWHEALTPTTSGG